jgi:hypothetical protein
LCVVGVLPPRLVTLLQGACMPANLVGTLSLTALGFAILAAAPAAHAQEQPRWQIEASLDATGANNGYSLSGHGENIDIRYTTHGALRFSLGASRLAPLGPRTSLRLGLSASDKGFRERRRINGETSQVHVDLLYLGAPLALGYNLVNTRRGLLPFAEVGVVPELLVRDDDSAYFDSDLERWGVSYLVSVGAKYNLDDGRALTIGPEFRHAAGGYSPRPGEFRPTTVGLKLGIQF